MAKPGFKRPPPPPQKGTGIGDWVVLKNNQLLAFNKPAALAVQSANAEAPTLQKLASAYAKRDLYLIHRIDQPAQRPGTVRAAQEERPGAPAAVRAAQRRADLPGRGR